MSKKKLEKAESVVVDVDSDVTSVSKDVVAVDKPKKSKKVTEVALERQIVDLEEALSKAKDAIESACADNERLSDELGVCTEENKSLRKELSKSKQDFKRVQADNRANSALVDTLNGELTQFKARNKELMETISRMQDNLAHYSDDLAAKDTSIREYEFDIASRDKDITKLKKDIEMLVAEVNKFKDVPLLKRIKFLFVGRLD